MASGHQCSFIYLGKNTEGVEVGERERVGKGYCNDCLAVTRGFRLLLPSTVVVKFKGHTISPFSVSISADSV